MPPVIILSSSTVSLLGKKKEDHTYCCLFHTRASSHTPILRVYFPGSCRCHSRPLRFVRLLRLLRRKGLVAEFVSVYLHEVQRAVYIATDGGRVCRPLLVCEKGRPRLTSMMMQQLSARLLTLAELIRNGVVEYVDVNEENNCLIALSQSELTPKHTHVEIDPLTVLGVVAGKLGKDHLRPEDMYMNDKLT